MSTANLSHAIDDQASDATDAQTCSVDASGESSSTSGDDLTLANIEAAAVVEAEAAKPPAMRILRIRDCASLSGRSTLTYHISGAGLASTANPELHLRIFANTAKGFFCKDWISLTLLDLLLTEAQTFASSTVQRMFFEGKSVNSGGFVLAALRNEGLARAIPGSLRSYERLDSAAWQQEIAALIQDGVALSEHQKPAPVTIKPQVKANQLGAKKAIGKKSRAA